MCLLSSLLLIIIIIIISIFKEDNVFSISASLPYGPPLNTDIDYYRIFSDLFIFASLGCEVSCAKIFFSEKRSQCLPYNAEHQAR